MKKILIYVLLLLLIGCTTTQALNTPVLPPPTNTILPPSPTSTLLPSPTNTATRTPEPTLQPALDYLNMSAEELVSLYQDYLPDQPVNFEWIVIPEIAVAISKPDEWYFKNDIDNPAGLGGVFVTKEDIDFTGRFTSGLSLYFLGKQESNLEAEKLAIGILENIKTLESITQILDNQESTMGDIIIRALVVETHYPADDEANQNKKIYYFTYQYEKRVYYGVFETPISEWDSTFKDYGLITVIIPLPGR